MSHILQSLYIKTLNPLFQLTGKIGNKSRDVIVFIFCLLIFIFFVFKRSALLNPYISAIFPSTFDKHLLGIVLLLLLSIFSINQPLQHVEWKNIILIPQLLMGLGIVIIGFIHPIGSGYQTFGFMLLFVFPCFYFVWNNRRDYDRLFELLVYAMIAVNMGLFLLHFYFAVKGQLTMEYARCAGIMSNSNVFSMVGVELVIGAVYLIVVKHLNWPLFILACSAIGAGLGVVLIGQMRLAVLILFFCLLSAAIFYVKYCEKRKTGIIIRLLAGSITVALLLFLSFALVHINQKAVETQNASTQAATEQATSTNESSTIANRFDIKGKNAESFSSGRTVIWKNYAKELNLLGNNYDEYDLEKMTSGRSVGPFAHNIFLEVGYRCGIPVGLLAVFICFVTGIMALGYLFFNASKTLYLLFPIMTVISYAASALLDCAVLPFSQAEVICYYFAMVVFIDKIK